MRPPCPAPLTGETSQCTAVTTSTEATGTLSPLTWHQETADGSATAAKGSATAAKGSAAAGEGVEEEAAAIPTARCASGRDDSHECGTVAADSDESARSLPSAAEQEEEAGRGTDVVDKVRDVGASVPPKIEAAASDGDSEPEEEEEAWDPPAVIDGTTVEFSLDPIKSQLSCGLCGGYFRDPFTITKCLHTFCRGCLYLAFSRGHYDCPSCGTYLGQDPQKCALPDGALQNLIDKTLFPDLAARDRQREEAFYARLGIARKPTATREAAAATAAAAAGGAGRDGADDEDREIHNRKKRPLDDGRPGDGDANDNPGSAAAPATEQVVFRLVPSQEPRDGLEALPPLTYPYLRTDGSIRIGQIKKYVALKLSLPSSSDPRQKGEQEEDDDPVESSLEILCQNVPLGNELSVQFARRALWSPTAGATSATDDDPGLTFAYRWAKPPRTMPPPASSHRG